MRKTTFFILCLEGALLSFNVAAAAALVPSIARDFAASPFVVGKIVWLYMLPYGITALLYGPLARSFDAKNIELACLFLFSLANLLTGLAQGLNSLFAGRFFMGIFGASVIPLALILIGRHVEEKKRGKYVGLFFAATFIASLLGLFLSGIISWRLIFILPAICGFLLCLAVYFYLPSFSRPMKEFTGGIPPLPDLSGSRLCREAGKEESAIFKINYLNALKNKSILLVFTYIFCISLFYHGIQQWLGVYFAKQFMFSQFAVSMLITLTSLSGIFGEGLGGLLSDKVGRVKTVNLGITLMIVSALGLLFLRPLVLLAMIMIVWGLGWTFNHAGVSTILTDLPKEFLNEVASLNSSVRFICGGVGAALGGMLIRENFNLWIVTFGICLSGLLFFTKKLII